MPTPSSLSNHILGPKGGELRGRIQENLMDVHECFAQRITYYLSHAKEDTRIDCMPACPRPNQVENSRAPFGMYCFIARRE